MPAIPKEGRGKRGKKTAEEAAYIQRCVDFGCLLSYLKLGVMGEPAVYHHRRTGTGAGCIARHADGFALAPCWHDQGNLSLHKMGRKAFERHWEITEQELIDLSKKMFDAPY